MVYQYKQKEILEERKKKSVCKGNKSALLLSKMYRRIERKNVTCPYKKKAQPTRCWGCREVEHVFWDCSNRAAQPKKAET